MPKGTTTTKKQLLEDTIAQLRKFRFCGPSDDPDEQTAVTVGYRYLVVQLKRLAGPFLAETMASRLNAINVEVNDLYFTYEARAEIDALLPDIEASLHLIDEIHVGTAANVWIVDSHIIKRMEALESTSLDLAFLARICKEINSSYAHGNVVATVLLMRAVLNHVPPVFGHKTFEQVVANAAKSLKESFNHLEEGLRKIADFHAHRKITSSEYYPSSVQVEPFKPQFDLLLQQVMTKIKP